MTALPAARLTSTLGMLRLDLTLDGGAEQRIDIVAPRECARTTREALLA
jgi:hypothetical protein